MKNLFSLLIISLTIILSCSNSYDLQNKESQSISSFEETEKMATNEKDESNAEIKQKKTAQIIKTASLSLEVKDFEKAKEEINFLIKKNHAYISKEDEKQNSYRLSNQIIIRVAFASFDTLINDIVQVADFLEHKSINLKDVGEEFFDLEIRLKNKKKVEERYLDLLKQANSITDILAIEDKIRVIREEIESKEGRLKFLKDQISYSTISVFYYKSITKTYKEEKFYNKLLNAFLNGWDSLLIFVVWIFNIWAFILIFVLLFFLVKKYFKKK